jgi:chitinase
MQLKKCSSTIKKSVQAVSMALAIGIASTASANCFLDKAVTGWTGSLTFHCDTDTDLLDNPITFDVSNGVKVISIWGINANTRYTQTENHVEATAKLWWPDAAYILPANQAATLSFSPSNDNFAITNFHIGTDQPASKATIRITLPEKPDNISTDVKPDITIYQGSEKVVEINNRDWGAIYHQEVSFSGSSADFSVKVASINVDSGADIGKAEPASFRLSNGQTQQVTISYEQPEPKEQGKISILAVAAGGSTPIVAPNYTITKGGSIITNGQLNFSAATVVDSLDVANGYVLDTPEFIDNGTQYVPEGGETHPFSIANNQTTSVSITYDAKIIPSERLNFNVTGLPSGGNTTINLVDGTNTKSIPVHGNGSYSASVLQNGDTWQISASTYNQYSASVTPNSFIANTDTQVVSVSYAESTSKWPAHAIVGYVKAYGDPWTTQPDTTIDMIKAAISHGYNVFVYAFGGQDSNNTPNLAVFSAEVLAGLPAQLAAIHQAGHLAILSVGGGANNTFEADLSGAKSTDAGTKMGEFLATQGFDGFDFDVEHPNASATSTNLVSYINTMRAAFKAKTGRDLILTAAPQVSGWYGTGQWASGSAQFAEPMYTQDFVNKAKFDAFLIQTYNQYGGAQFGGLKGYNEGFLSMTFGLLSADTRKEIPGITPNAFVVPSGTKIVLGVPDFKDPSITDAQYQQGSCLATAMCSGVGLYKPSDINEDISQGQFNDIQFGNLHQYPQYGGLMTWIVNSDAYQGWTWVDGIKTAA